MTRQNLGNYTTTWHYDLIFNFYCFWREIYCYLFHYFFVYNTCFLPVCCTDFSFATWFEWHSVQFSRSVVSDSLWSHELQHTRPPCPSPTPGVHLNPCPSSRWCHQAISSSVVSFSFCPQSFPASGSLPMSQFFTSGGQSIGVSASTSILPMNINDWLSLEWIGWISLQSKGLSRVFSNTTIQKQEFFSAQLPLQCDSHICSWPLEKP